MSRRREVQLAWWVGLIAWACYAAHAGYFIAVDRPSNLLWGCHLAALGVGTGIVLRVPTFNGMGMISLMWGVPLWLLDVFTGGEFLPTSMLTHIGGAILGVVGVRHLGMPKWTWLKLWGTTVLLVGVSHLVGPELENVNLSHGPPKGWEERLPPYPTFGVILFAGAAGFFFACEQILRRAFRAHLWDLEA